MNDINDFVDRLIEEKGVADMDLAVLAEFKKDLRERVNERINAAIVEHMPSHLLPEFETMLDDNVEPAVMQAYIQKHILNLPEVLAAALLDFKNAYLGQ